jgi:hypothetical protein
MVFLQSMSTRLPLRRSRPHSSRPVTPAMTLSRGATPWIVPTGHHTRCSSAGDSSESGRIDTQKRIRLCRCDDCRTLACRNVDTGGPASNSDDSGSQSALPESSVSVTHRRSCNRFDCCGLVITAMEVHACAEAAYLPVPSMDVLHALDELDEDDGGFLRYLETLDDCMEEVGAAGCEPVMQCMSAVDASDDGSAQNVGARSRASSGRATPLSQLERQRAKNRKAQAKYRTRLKVRHQAQG